MNCFVAFLRGINVGGKNLVAMSELRSLFEGLGFTSVKTVLQSGNVVFQSSDLDTLAIRSRLETEIETKFKRRISIVVLTRSEICWAIAKNPYSEEAKTDPSHVVFYFGNRKIDSDQVCDVQSQIKGPEKLTSRGGQIFMVYPNGIGTSTVGKTPGFAKLTSDLTARNWNTMNKIASLLGPESSSWKTPITF